MQFASVSFVSMLILIVIQFNCGYSQVVKDNTSQVIVTPQYLTQNRLFNFLYPNVNLTLEELIAAEENTWHFVPYKRIQYFVSKAKGECSEDLTDDEGDIFTWEQLRSGAIILHFIGVAYMFILLAIVCDDYFLPSVECICEDLGLPADVAAATFMSVATTSPEFFVNTISTFITESDLGLGTIVGSLMFSTLGIAAIASLAARNTVQMDWWPITRDCLVYAIILAFLVAFGWDGAVYWYESLVMILLSIGYFAVMFNNHRLKKLVKKYVEGKWNCCQNTKLNYDSQQKPQPTITVSTITLVDDFGAESHSDQIESHPEKPSMPLQGDEEEQSLWRIPKVSKFRICWWFLIWPIKFLLTFTIPNPKTFRKWYPLSFIMCIVWIGANSYIIVELIVIIGQTFDIPDSVMGLTFLAGGSNLPEAISAVITTRRGEGDMGISNALGANSLAVLLSLSVPWFIKSMIDGGASTGAYIDIDSLGIEFVFLSLLVTVACLYISVAIGGFKLRKLVGYSLSVMYLIFLTITVLIELDVLFPTGIKC